MVRFIFRWAYLALFFLMLRTLFIFAWVRAIVGSFAQRGRLNPWGCLTLFMLTGSASGMAIALFCAWQMITGHPS